MALHLTFSIHLFVQFGVGLFAILVKRLNISDTDITFKYLILVTCLKIFKLVTRRIPELLSVVKIYLKLLIRFHESV